MSRIRRILIPSLIGLALWAPYIASADDDSVVEKGFRLLADARRMSPEGFKQHGRKFDQLVAEYWDRAVQDGLAERIEQTFLGDNIERGFRVGNTEIWLQKQVAPGVSNRSLDVIVWNVERDANGTILSARGVGMDHHTVHPQSPRAVEANRVHWQEKVTTGEFWERRIKAAGIEHVTLEMQPGNSFYWRDVAMESAGEIDAFTRAQETRATNQARNLFGSSIFISTAAKSLGTSASLLGVAQSGIKLLDALRVFYVSPVVSRTISLLENGQYEQARRYWQQLCVAEPTMHRDCEHLRRVVAEESSLLGVVSYTYFPQAMEKMYRNWESGMIEAHNLIQNGSFELGPDPQNYATLSAGAISLPSWTITKGTIDVVGSYFPSAHGSRHIDMDGTPGSGTIQQILTTNSGKGYRLLFEMAANPTCPPLVKLLRVHAGGQSADFTHESNLNWTHHEWLFTARGAQTTLVFESRDPEGGACGALLDKVAVVPR